MGDRFGPYELLEPLAAGGMARVYRARMSGALGFEKIVAVKFMLPDFAADPLAVKMFVDEARLAATLTHANIVGILDFGERDGEHYIAMEYVSGANARVLVRRAAETGRLPSPAIAAHIVSEAARGLEYAHAKTDAEGRALHIVHRDVSPQNIVVSWDGEVKILDFGIARSRQRSFETAVGTIKGKCAYMSPEQALGQAVDHRSDLFSLGAVLYELLTGTKAFPQPGLDALEKVRLAEFVAAEVLRPDLPPGLVAILRRSMARDPDQRYRSASAMLDDLRIFMAEDRASGATSVDAAALSTWAQGLFEVSDSDIAVGGTEPDFPAPAPVAEPGLLPGWGDTDNSNAAAREPAPAVRRPAATALASMTFTGSEEPEADDGVRDVTMVTLQPASASGASPAVGAGWVLPPAPSPGRVQPPSFAPPPPSPSSAGPAPPPLPTPPPPSAIPEAAPVAQPSVRAGDRSSAPREQVSRAGAVPPRNAPATTPSPAVETPRTIDFRSPVILFAGALTGAALMTAVFHFAVGSGRAPEPTPTPVPSATPAATTTEVLVVETPVAVTDTRDAIAVSDDPLAARPGEKRVGILSISSEPARGQVFVDGKPIDESPVLVPNVPVPRRYVVEVRLDGHFPWSREVDVIDDQARQVVAKMVPIDVPGKLRVTIPRGGTAYVDGRLAGKGPAIVTLEVSPGEHQLRVKDANDLILREYEVLVAKGRTTEVDLPAP